jgi:6-phosphogluconolactonase
VRLGEVEIIVADRPVRLAAETIASAVHEGGHIALSGGSTPRPAYKLAAELEPGWSQVDVWLGDERCVPPDDDRANIRLVREALAELTRAPILHPVDTTSTPAEAAEGYDSALQGVTLDLAFQGLGPDGHTASLFPKAASLDETERRAVSAPAGLEPFVERVTMTVPMLCAARQVVFLVVGVEKAEAVRRAFAEPPSRATPASLVRSASGTTVAILDRAAASSLAPT